MKKIFTILFFLILISTYAQKKKNYFPIWTFHQKNINIHGVSIGFASARGGYVPKNTNTNGIKIELIGLGIVVPLIPESPVAKNELEFKQFQREPISEKINGLSLSASGSVCDCRINGISLGLIGQIEYKVNGISAAVFMNFAQEHNGIQLAAFNQSYKMRGLQIGLFNFSKNTKGIQIGAWNVNEKRKLPIINWNF